MDEELTPGPTYRITIGYAEDEYICLTNTVEILEEHGFIIDFAVRDGDQLLRVAKQCPTRPDIYITDLNMPRLDGISAARKLINQYPESKVIIMTGELEQRYIEQARAAGVSAYINKMITPAKLYQAIKEVYYHGKTDVGWI